MKVQRYLYGRTNIAQLESRRSRLRSPAEVAAEAYAPYGAVEQATGAIVDALQVEDQRRKRIIGEEDAIEAKLLAVQLKAGISDSITNPKYQNRIQADGTTPSASAMLDDYEVFAKDIISGLNKIQDPTTRRNTERLMGVAIDEGRLAVRSAANAKSEEWNTAAQFDLRSVAFQAQDWTFYQEINDELRDAGKQSQKQYEAAEKLASIQKKQVEVDQTLQSYDQAIAHGMGEEVLTGQLENPNSDPDVQKALVAGIKAQMGNYDKAQSKQEAVIKGQMIRDFNGLKSAIESNQPVPADAIANWYAAAADVDPTWAAEKEGQLLSAKATGLGVANNVAEAALRLRAGQPLMNNKTEREGLDGVIALSIPIEANDQEAQEISVSIQKQAQIPSNQSWRLMSAGGRDVNSTIAGSETYMSLVDPNDLHQMDLNITEEKEMLYSQIALMTVSDSMTVREAAEIMQERYKIQRKDPDKYEALTNIWKADGAGVESAQESFNDMLDTYYDKIPIIGFSGVEGAKSIKSDIVSSDAETQANFYRYQRYYKNAWLLTEGNADEAKELSDVMYQRSTPVTNINGKWQAQYQGIAGNAEFLATEWKTEFSENKYLARNENGQFQPFTMEQLSDDITFENPIKTADGQTQYTLFYKGEQLSPWSEGMTAPESALMGATATFDKADVAKMNKDNNPIKKKISLLEAQSAILKAEGYKTGISESEIGRMTTALDRQYPNL